MKPRMNRCLLSAAAVALALGCAEEAPVDAPSLRVEGPTMVPQGESVTWTVSTVGGTDTSYSFSSADEEIAQADATGVVRGLGAGETKITVTGDNSGATATFPVVVVPAEVRVPYYEAWLGSAHADRTAEAFRHWDSDTPAEVPARCAKCHSKDGYLDFLGADGSEADLVDGPAAVGSVIDCETCHNTTAAKLSHVVFPSGVRVEGLGAEARCMTCHQGRASSVSLDEAIGELAADQDDVVQDGLGFQNIHYYAAGATLLAGRVKGGYQYTGQVYDWRFRHVPGRDTCVGCHSPHSLQVRIDVCGDCHEGVATPEDTRNIRSLVSLGQDYDGDGDQGEGIYYEIQTLREKLLTALALYTEAQGLTAICYDSHAYPYFFQDTNADGACDEEEASFSNQYAQWTPRLLRAAYNYQVASKDPGAFAHNAKYIIQLLFDSISDLDTTVDMANAVRNDPGHFNGASEAARHWDEDEEVSASCAKCHGGAEGFRFYLEHGVGANVLEPDNGLDCATCHNDLSNPSELVTVESVTFPGDVKATFSANSSNICATCHSGRQSGATVEAAIARGTRGFLNVHYLPAAAVWLGTNSGLGAEYDGKTYAGARVHVSDDGSQCVFCHQPSATNHSFSPAEAFAAENGCGSTCHAGVASVDEIRGDDRPDFDGDGNTDEPLGAELEALAGALLTQMQASTASSAPKLCYDGHAYPYFFQDGDESGACDNGEANYGNRYPSSGWTPALMRAAHNYQISQKAEGGWAHNADYVAQLLIDSIEDLGGDVSSYERP